VYQGSLTVATSLLSPPFGSFFQPGVCTDCRYDPARAKELATRAGLTPGTRLRFSYNNDGGHEALVQAIKDQLERNLGVVVDLDGVPFAEQLEQRDRGEFDIARAAWTADYPTADNFLFPLLASTADDNDGKYSNPEFDNLLTRARAEKSETERVRLLKEAERLAIGRDLAAIPTFYRTQYRVFDSKKWQGVGLDFYENPTIEQISLK
jgi:oligopeptide transport system substrate-binding protein